MTCRFCCDGRGTEDGWKDSRLVGCSYVLIYSWFDREGSDPCHTGEGHIRVTRDLCLQQEVGVTTCRLRSRISTEMESISQADSAFERAWPMLAARWTEIVVVNWFSAGIYDSLIAWCQKMHATLTEKRLPQVIRQRNKASNSLKIFMTLPKACVLSPMTTIL
jgi:hypothetical protein